VEFAEFYDYLVNALERIGIPYRIVGSMASIAYGEPRFTNDIDVVVRLEPDQVEAFCAEFPAPGFYCPVETAREAVLRRFQFNILHPASGLKADIILATDSPFDRSRFARGQRLFSTDTRQAWIASPEDVILKKLVFFREGGSEKHLRDIVGILKVQGEGIEHAYLKDWVARLGVEAEWRLVLSRMPTPSGGTP
jgi:hypothetical protein